MVTRSFPTTGVTYGLERARWLQMDPEQAEGKVNQSLSLTLPPGRELSIYYSLMYLFIYYNLHILLFKNLHFSRWGFTHWSPKPWFTEMSGKPSNSENRYKVSFHSVCTKTSTEPRVLGLVWPSDCSELLAILRTNTPSGPCHSGLPQLATAGSLHGWGTVHSNIKGQTLSSKCTMCLGQKQNKRPFQDAFQIPETHWVEKWSPFPLIF